MDQRTMTSQEALALALVEVLGHGEVSTNDGSTGVEKTSPLILAALPEGWALMKSKAAPEFEYDPPSYHLGRADGAQQERERLPDLITRWMMGEGMVVVHRWMTTGWRETMYDEGVRIWTDLLAEPRP